MNKRFKGIILILMLLFAATLIAGCNKDDLRSKIGEATLFVNESYSIPGTNYYFTLKEMSPGTDTNSPSAVIEIYQNGQFIERKFLYRCRRCYSDGSARYGNVEVENWGVGTDSALFYIYKYPG